MPSYATTEDVAVLLGRELDEAEVTMVDRRLAQVERLILRRIPDLADRAEDQDYLADLVDIEADAVARVVRAGDGVTMETDGEYSYQKSWDAADNTLRLTTEEWLTLGYTSSVGMFSLVPRV